MFKDKVNIRCKQDDNYMSEIRINGKTVPYVTSYSLYQGVGERPQLELELSMGDLSYNGPANISVDAIFDNKELAKEIYKKIEEKYDFD